MSRPTTPDILDNLLAASPAVAAVSPAATLLALTAIVNDGGTQMRAGMNAEKVKEYEEVLADAEAWPFPALVVFHDGSRYWLADGFHRLNAAHRSKKFAEIPAEIKAGTRRDAVLYAAGANATHGLPRTNDDKRRAVKTLLEDEEWAKWSDREIARRCAVSQPFVSALRKELSDKGYQMPTARTVERGGQTYQQNTQNIGSNRPARLFVGDLKGLVAKWMGMHWQHAWPDNPSHTNGEFWQSLVAWMHENVRETWQEGDLKEAIKALHWLSRPEPQPATPAPSQQIAPASIPARVEIFEIEQVVRRVASEERSTAADLRTMARQRIGRVWLECRKALPADVAYRDLAQAMNNVAEQMVSRQNAPVPMTTIAPTVAYVVPAVDGDRPLPEWAQEEPVLPQAQEPQTAAGVVVEDDLHAELQRWWVRLMSVRSDLGDWARLTGRFTDTLVLARELTKLIDITQSEMDAIATADRTSGKAVAA